MQTILGFLPGLLFWSVLGFGIYRVIKNWKPATSYTQRIYRLLVGMLIVVFIGGIVGLVAWQIHKDNEESKRLDREIHKLKQELGQ